MNIYELALTPKGGGKRQFWFNHGQLWPALFQSGSSLGEFPQFLNTSRQIRDETLPVFWAMNDLSILLKVQYGEDATTAVGVNFMLDADAKLLESLGRKQGAMIQSLTLQYVVVNGQGDLPYTEKEVFQRLQLEKFGIRESVVKLYAIRMP